MCSIGGLFSSLGGGFLKLVPIHVCDSTVSPWMRWWKSFVNNSLSRSWSFVSPLANVVSRGNHYLVIKLCTRHPFNNEAFKTTLRKIWRPAKQVHFHELGSVLILTEFEDCLDKKRVIQDNPWSFERNLILLQEFDKKNRSRTYT